MHAVMSFDNNFAVEPPAKASQSPSMSQKPRWMHSIVHHKLLLNNCVLFSVDVKTGGDDCTIVQLSAVALNLQLKYSLENLASMSSQPTMLNGVKHL